MKDRPMGHEICILCSSPNVTPLAVVDARPYFHCESCGLAFMSPEFRPTPEQERARYALHNNDPADERYRQFLTQVSEPLVPRLHPGAEGLDFGCGPGPTLSVMLREQGFHVRDYDPFFALDDDALQRTYDFITCTETVEHFHHPADEFRTLDALLRPGGLLAVMTEILDDTPDTLANGQRHPRPGDLAGQPPHEPAFAKWWYVRDPTHVCFYRRRTMLWIAEWRHWQVHFPSRKVTLFSKTHGN